MVSQFQWTELNRRRNYPFTDASTLKLGPIVLPKEWVIDATLSPTQTGLNESYYFLSRATKDENKITLILSSNLGEVASAAFDIKSAASHVKFYNIKGLQYAGSMIINPAYAVVLANLPNGNTRIDNKAAVFVPGVVHPIPYPSVSSLLASSGKKALAGEAYIVAGEGVTFSQVGTTNTIKVDIIGDPNYSRYDCSVDQVSYTQSGIKSITPCVLNNDGTVNVGPAVTADEHGTFTILPSNVYGGSSDDMYEGRKPTLRIYPKSGQLFFEIAGLARRLQ